jgi:D-Tyr-tRNAtyr deacylase
MPDPGSLNKMWYFVRRTIGLFAHLTSKFVSTKTHILLAAEFKDSLSQKRSVARQCSTYKILNCQKDKKSEVYDIQSPVLFVPPVLYQTFTSA